MLTAVHRQQRLEFPCQYHNCTSTERPHVALSDELHFMLHRTAGRWRIRRKTSESKHPATTPGMAGGGSIRLRRMFSWHSLGSLIIVEGMIDQYKYELVLMDHAAIFSLRMMASNSRTIQSVIQLEVYVRVSKSTKMSLPFSPGKKTHLT
ncbi:transposable element Tcb1 transposase [Trichonephila clavipes]|nr:transposable element Tcb1 transposase [Trichonephila clavipes]